MRVKYTICEACGELKYSKALKRCKYCGYSEEYATSWRVVITEKEQP